MKKVAKKLWNSSPIEAIETAPLRPVLEVQQNDFDFLQLKIENNQNPSIKNSYGPYRSFQRHHWPVWYQN